MGAKSICDGLGRWHEIALALERAGGTPQLLQKIIGSPGNSAAIKMVRAAAANVKIDLSSVLFDSAIEVIDFTVPLDYEQGKWLAKNRLENASDYSFCDPNITDDIFKYPYAMVPGKTYRAAFFPVLKDLEFEDVMQFTKKRPAVLMAYHGLSLLYHLHKDQFPEGYSFFTAEHDSSLYPGTVEAFSLPYIINRKKDGLKPEFRMSQVNKNNGSRQCLVCFYEETKARKALSNVKLKRLTRKKKITVRATDGSRLLAYATSTFTEIGYKIKELGLHKLALAAPTAPMDVDIYSVNAYAGIQDIFEATGRDLAQLVMTQDQIIAFCEDHRNWLRDCSIASFIIQDDNDIYYDVSVSLRRNGSLSVNAYWLDQCQVDGDHACRIVVPRKK